MEKTLQNIADNLDEIAGNQVSDSTATQILHSLEWIAFELKRMNDREESN